MRVFGVLNIRFKRLFELCKEYIVNVSPCDLLPLRENTLFFKKTRLLIRDESR